MTKKADKVDLEKLAKSKQAKKNVLIDNSKIDKV